MLPPNGVASRQGVRLDHRAIRQALAPRIPQGAHPSNPPPRGGGAAEDAGVIVLTTGGAAGLAVSGSVSADRLGRLANAGAWVPDTSPRGSRPLVIYLLSAIAAEPRSYSGVRARSAPAPRGGRVRRAGSLLVPFAQHRDEPPAAPGACSGCPSWRRRCSWNSCQRGVACHRRLAEALLAPQHRGNFRGMSKVVPRSPFQATAGAINCV